MDDFLAKLADILEVDNVGSSDVLDGYAEWDSLAVLSTIAMVGTDYGVTLSASDLRGVETAGALRELVEKRIAG